MRSERRARRTARRALVNQVARRANKARKEHDLCEHAVDQRRYTSQAEAEAAKSEPGQVCDACGKEILRFFFVAEKPATERERITG